MAPLGLYVHWPFCLAKCPYCDFNSHLRDHVDHPLWAERLVQEMETMASQARREGEPLSSIFIGGGTPSLMAPATMANVIEAARRIFGFLPDIEITMEANPTSVEAAKLEAFATAGVSRLSMGIQSLDPAALTMLGREHSAEEALAALATARALFSRVSADFIYCRPGQTEADWQQELGRILDLGLDHLSLYQLTLEPGTAFFSRHQRGLMSMPDDETGRQFYDLTQQMTDAAGLPAYEISNHAAPGQESRHNLIYWRAHDWLGIGPGAFGRYWLDGQRVETRMRRNPDGWLNSVANEGHGIDATACDGSDDAVAEMLMMGLRLKEGVDLARLRSIAPKGTLPSMAALDAAVSHGFIFRKGDRIALSAKGFPLINTILAQLLA